jgi:glycerol-3-phosphate dehydrogenase
VGGKYTTFRVLSQDVVSRAAVLMRRESVPRDDSPPPLPAPFPDGGATRRSPSTRSANEWAAHARGPGAAGAARAGSRTTAGLAAARRMAPVLGRHHGWDAARVKDEIDRFEASGAR